MPTRFAHDTAVTAIGDGVFTGQMDPGWWIERGPNGGYVAAIITRALDAAVNDPVRSLSSLTVHYLAPPVEGPVRIETNLARSGRQMSFVTGRVAQGDRLIALAQAAFARPLVGPEFDDMERPEVPSPDAVAPPPPPDFVAPFRDRWETRWVYGSPAAPTDPSSPAVVGGWIRLRPDEGAGPFDNELLVAITDAWMPPVFTRLSTRMPVPTVDLTVHVRSALPADAGEWVLAVFRSRLAGSGFVDEDGEVWTADGRLLAQSRQLAMLMQLPG
jgi:acyl-CoA thioesterase